MGADAKNAVVKKFQVSGTLQYIIIALLVVGVLTFGAGLFAAKERVWTSYLVAFFFFSCLGLGGLFWAAVNNLANAGWSVSIRRYAEGMTSFMPVILIGGLILIAGFKYLYPWADPEQVHGNEALAAKTAYLNTGFFIFRLVLFCGGWFLFRYLIVGNSLKQDTTGDDNLTHKNVGISVLFVLFFALTFSLFSVDLLMSLSPSWYSTIFGVYCFAGMFQASMATLLLIIIGLDKAGFVQGYVTVEHQHDVAKYMKGFTVFWAYIAFSQFMLIWYANIPEETEFFVMRSQGGWLLVSVILLIFRFFVPFIGLLPRDAKRNQNYVIAVSILVLAMQYLDIYWMVYPNFYDGHVEFGVWEIGIFCLFAGLFLLLLTSFFKKNSLVPVKDPRIHEALIHHVTY